MWRQNTAFELWQTSLVPHSDNGPSFSVEIRLWKIGGFFWIVIDVQAEGNFSWWTCFCRYFIRCKQELVRFDINIAGFWCSFFYLLISGVRLFKFSSWYASFMGCFACGWLRLLLLEFVHFDLSPCSIRKRLLGHLWGFSGANL